MFYEMTIAGLKRQLPLCKVTDDLYIAAFIMFSDVEITKAAAGELLKRAPQFDIMTQIWARDMNTFIEIACEESDPHELREAILLFFALQQPNDEMIDGYVLKEDFTWYDDTPYYSNAAPKHMEVFQMKKVLYKWMPLS